jgi:chromosome segregation protein
MTELGTSLDRARAGAMETEIAHVSAEKDLERTRNEIERGAARLQSQRVEFEELGRTVEAAVTEEGTLRAALDDLVRTLEQSRIALARATEGATAWRERLSGQAALVTERKVRLAQVREQLDAAGAQLTRLAASIADHEDRLDRVQRDGLEAARSFGDTAALIVMDRERLQAANQVAREAHHGLDEVRRLLEEIRYALGEKEGALRALRADLSLAEETAREHELKLQKLELEREHLLQGVRERFRGLDLHRVVGKYHALPAVDDEHRRGSTSWPSSSSAWARSTSTRRRSTKTPRGATRRKRRSP